MLFFQRNTIQKKKTNKLDKRGVQKCGVVVTDGGRRVQESSGEPTSVFAIIYVPATRFAGVEGSEALFRSDFGGLTGYPKRTIAHAHSQCNGRA